MLSEERRREIMELLRNDGRVLVRDLSKRFRTSLITIRKDLESLHHQGMLERTHGGALPIRTGAIQDQTLREKERLHRQEKMRIAAAALRLIRPGQVIILDSGTTTTAIARGCRQLRSLTVITNATNIAAELADSNVEVILTGGSLRKRSFSLVGPLAEESLRKLSADMLFLAVDGFDVGYGLSTPINWRPGSIAQCPSRRGAPSWYAIPRNLAAEVCRSSWTFPRCTKPSPTGASQARPESLTRSRSGSHPGLARSCPHRKFCCSESPLDFVTNSK